ncbi:MAG TPA: CoA-binding protein, partial [Candidatus Hydrogenedentes bacterium]|nr:CoA-binding protein [Candidatus Hydrogenedentota bacterium]
MSKTIAIVGASNDRTKYGNKAVRAFKDGGWTVYPVNPNRPSVMGIKAYPTVADVPDQIDLAVVVTPAKAIPALISECADVGVKGAIVISAGFKELGAPGIALEEEILRHAQRGRMRIVGPNCLGVMNPITGLNATFAGTMARPGNV